MKRPLPESCSGGSGIGLYYLPGRREELTALTVDTVDLDGGAVLVFDRDGKLLETWGEDLYTTPHGMWIGPQDEIFMTDSADHTVRKYAPSGELLMTLGVKGQPGSPGSPFNRPTRAVMSPGGEIFVGDGYGQNRVHRFTAKGELITLSEATIKVEVKGEKIMTVAEGNGPVNALDNALRKSLIPSFEMLEDMRLVDYKVRILTPSDGTMVASERVMS